MTQAGLYRQNGEKAGEVGLPESYFGAQIKEGPVYYAVNALLTNQRQGDASTKTRGQVNFSTKKPWRQKGTGRARAGMRSSPVWRHGGTVFGPHPKEYDVRVPKKVRRAALVSALSAKAQEQASVVVIESIEMAAPKTREVADFLKKVDACGKRVLFMLEAVNPMFWKSARNLERVAVKPFSECSAYDVLLAEKLVIERSVLDQLEQK
ncbi:50S ribosomal protein L4 [bacterium]|nr:50S ribosomal protein L4 [bacterium]